MKHVNRIFGSCLLLLLILVSCQEVEPPSEEVRVVHPGSPQAYYDELYEDRAKKEPQEIIDLANKGLAAADDIQDTILPYLLSNKIYYHNRLRQYDSSLFFADSLYSLGQVQGDTAFIAEGLYRKYAVYNYYLDDNRKAYEYAFKAHKLHLQQGDSTMAADRMLNMARVQLRVGDYSGSYEWSTAVLDYALRHKDSNLISLAHSDLGQAYRGQGFYTEAVQEYQNAFPYVQKEHLKKALRNNLAMVQLDQGDYESAVEGMEQLLEEIDTSNLERLALYTSNLAYARWKQDPSRDVEEDFLEALKIRLEIEDKFGLMDSYDYLYQFYLDKNPEKAREMALKYLDLAQETDRVESEVNALRQLMAVSPPEEVVEYSRRYVKLNDSLTMSMLREKNAFAKIKFDEESKEKEILSLKVSNARQELATQRWRTRNFIALLLGSLTFLGILFFIYFLRQRYKRARVKEVYLTENRISKRIHDELANDVYNVMSSLEAVAPTETVDKLEYIYKRTRDISRENSEIETGTEFSPSLLSMLSNTTGKARLIIKGESSVNWNKVSEEKKIVVYRVLQELMVNMKKHSQAKIVAVTFSRKAKFLEIKYSDIGVGVDPKILGDRNGLQNVENRIKSVGGTISFTTGQGKGFKADLQIPI